ncbi:LytR/AlgR family response regulator transcription factor, partial [Fulvivirga kasyanovii]
VKALCESVDEGVKAIREHRPDMIFLDIQMQRETGFDLLNKIENIDFEVVFTTAHSEYAIKAFKFCAVDYLLKPIDLEELKQSIARVRDRLHQDISQRLEQLMKSLSPAQNQISKLALPTSTGLSFVRIEDILYCEAVSNYTKFFLADGSMHLVSRTLKEYDSMLSGHNFCRIHNSYLINLNAIKEYVRGEGGYVVLNNNITLDVSKRKKVEFLKKLGY